MMNTLACIIWVFWPAMWMHPAGPHITPGFWPFYTTTMERCELDRDDIFDSLSNDPRYGLAVAVVGLPEGVKLVGPKAQLVEGRYGQ